jgi:hypothetical protein
MTIRVVDINGHTIASGPDAKMNMSVSAVSLTSGAPLILTGALATNGLIILSACNHLH